jgi:hypothetical protein
MWSLGLSNLEKSASRLSHMSAAAFKGTAGAPPRALDEARSSERPQPCLKLRQLRGKSARPWYLLNFKFHIFILIWQIHTFQVQRSSSHSAPEEVCVVISSTSSELGQFLSKVSMNCRSGVWWVKLIVWNRPHIVYGLSLQLNSALRVAPGLTNLWPSVRNIIKHTQCNSLQDMMGQTYWHTKCKQTTIPHSKTAHSVLCPVLCSLLVPRHLAAL